MLKPIRAWLMPMTIAHEMEAQRGRSMKSHPTYVITPVSRRMIDLVNSRASPVGRIFADLKYSLTRSLRTWENVPWGLLNFATCIECSSLLLWCGLNSRIRKFTDLRIPLRGGYARQMLMPKDLGRVERCNARIAPLLGDCTKVYDVVGLVYDLNPQDGLHDVFHRE